MRSVWIVGRREFGSYFATPLAYVFVFMFLALVAVLSFYLGGFYERGQADLEPFFALHPWVYLLLIPALSMRTWAEEKRSGSIELLLTHPLTLGQAVLAKFLAAWAMAALALALTFPLWITVNYLGNPDNGAILAAYLGSLLMAGGMLAIGSCMSALTANQVVAFILAVVVTLLFLFSGAPLVLDAFSAYAPAPFLDTIASFSFLTHFQSIMKGVVDLRDVVFFATVIATFLAATVIVLGGRRRAAGLEAAVLAVVLFAVTMLANVLLRGARLDLTENRQYTPAAGSRGIVAALDEPVNLYFYYSGDAARAFPQLATYGAQVRDFLQELAARSQGKLRLSLIDPQPFSEDEDRAEELGVHALPAQAHGAPPIYFGLAATNATDGREAIPFFDPRREEFLEYDVVKLIHQLGTARKPVVGWLSSLPMTPSFDPQSGQMRDPNFLFSQAQQLFDVRLLDAGLAAVDADVDVLVIVHPRRLPAAALFAIDQFALRGGRVLAFVDPLADSDRTGTDEMGGMLPGARDRSSTLEPLLATWGVRFDPAVVVADPVHAMEVGVAPGQPPVRHLAILGLDRASLNEKDVVTASLSNVNVMMSGFLLPAPESKLTFEALLSTAAEAAALPGTRFAMLTDPATLLDEFQPGGKALAIAARINGSIGTAFPDGPPPGVALPAGQAPLRESNQPFNAIIVADTDLFSDFIWVRVQNFFGSVMAQPFASNGDFVLNAIDNLAGSGDLISLRGRASFSRPFERVEELQRAAESRFRQKERELEEQLRETERKLGELQDERDQRSALLLTPAQEQALDSFAAEKLRIRRELRAVRAGLDQDIRHLGGWLKFINGVLAPAVLVLALGLIARRLRRGGR